MGQLEGVGDRRQQEEDEVGAHRHPAEDGDRSEPEAGVETALGVDQHDQRQEGQQLEVDRRRLAQHRPGPEVKRRHPGQQQREGIAASEHHHLGDDGPEPPRRLGRGPPDLSRHGFHDRHSPSRRLS